ncbi:hypothetical protein B0O99DRAFT_578946 [Bisporella sp. PMI_857]|nr:hypothetical protein B0O99DRAFT_578946 [Bisporella sp. PMI_857]
MSAEKVHLILTGGTGLVGSAVLHHMLNNPAIHQISILARGPVRQAEGHGKAKVIIHKDFTQYPKSLLDELSGAQGVVWAQGISQNAVTKEEYVKITYDYPIAAAKAFATLNSPKPFRFVYVSGEGATTAPGPLTMFFGRIKGQTEAALLSLSKSPEHALLRPYSLRPGGVDARDHPEIRDFVPALGIAKSGLMALLRLRGSIISPTRELGCVLTELALGDGEALSGVGVDGEGRTVSNVGFRRMAGL